MAELSSYNFLLANKNVINNYKREHNCRVLDGVGLRIWWRKRLGLEGAQESEHLLKWLVVLLNIWSWEVLEREADYSGG